MSVIQQPQATAQPPKAHGVWQQRWPERGVGTLLSNLLILALWCWLYHPLFRYLSVIFSDQFFRTNQLILLVVLALMLLQARRGGLGFRLDIRPQLAWLPLAVALGAAVGYLLVERFLDMNILATTLALLASYGLLGLWLTPVRWRQGLPAVLLLMGALPFGDHLQTFVGYPLRIATAHLVGEGLRLLGVASVGADTILTFENGIAHVDLPCSGIKSLWTGGLFLIAATWIEQQRLNLRWLGIAAVLGSFLVVGNFVRVAVLVTVGVVGQLRLLAEMLHVPLGVLSFGIACGVTLWLLRRGRPVGAATAAEREPPGREAAPVLRPRPIWLPPTLMACIGILALLYQPRPQTGLQALPPAWSFPAAITTTVEPLTADEIWWLSKDGAESADRRRFQWGDVSGSMLLITSQTWRAHHRPERCFEVKGLAVDDLRTHLVTPDFPLRVVALGQGNQHNTHSAVYWFQAADQITEDYGTRMWADVAPDRQRWVLVAILFDDHRPPDRAALAPFYQAVAAAVDAGLAQRVGGVKR